MYSCSHTFVQVLIRFLLHFIYNIIRMYSPLLLFYNLHEMHMPMILFSFLDVPMGLDKKAKIKFRVHHHCDPPMLAENMQAANTTKTKKVAAVCCILSCFGRLDNHTRNYSLQPEQNLNIYKKTPHRHTNMHLHTLQWYTGLYWQLGVIVHAQRLGDYHGWNAQDGFCPWRYSSPRSFVSESQRKKCIAC